MSVIVTGSIATDYLMRFPGHFAEHVLLNEVGKISVSFLVEEKEMHRGGVGPNICYSLALLGERPQLMGTAGGDFAEYASWLQAHGVDTSLVRIYPDEFTATFTVITDLDQNQIAGFHAGAMSRGRELTFHGLGCTSSDLVVISPNDPVGMVNLAAECCELCIPFIFDPSQQLARLNGEQIRASMCGAHALTVNDYELEMIRHKTGFDEDDILDRVRMLIVTRGPDGATLMDKSHRVDVPVATPTVLRDPTGVGDAFRAGLIVGLVRSYPWEVAGRLGALAATYCLEQSGSMNHSYTVPEFVARYRATFGDEPALQDILNRSRGGYSE